MTLRTSLGAAMLCLVGVTPVACGGDGNSTVSNVTPGSNSSALTATAAAKGTSTPAGTPSAFGPAPKIDGNIEAITPIHASTVTQASTRTTDPVNPHGVCVSVNFNAPVQNLQWFRMALDGAEVTPKLTIRVDSANPPKGATLCYAPAEGLAAGRHTAAFSVGNPGNLNATPNQVIGWAFEVGP
jgi:hypothetical protein